MPRLFPPLLMATLLAAPALAQDPLTRPGEAPRAATSAADPCEVYYNELTIRVDPGYSGIPVIIRPFTSVDEWPPETLELYQRCQPMLESPPALVTWTGVGPGMRPLGDETNTEMLSRQPARPGLPGEPQQPMDNARRQELRGDGPGR